MFADGCTCANENTPLSCRQSDQIELSDVSHSDVRRFLWVTLDVFLSFKNGLL